MSKPGLICCANHREAEAAIWKAFTIGTAVAGRFSTFDDVKRSYTIADVEF